MAADTAGAGVSRGPERDDEYGAEGGVAVGAGVSRGPAMDAGGSAAAGQSGASLKEAVGS
ncbi:hypothetical protein ACFO9Q_03685 [Paenibacillus sp. GCM10023252]|uniref:hypothetical protein n=1 Tax=Paenibacillus sp. GCM10023252 TaxID=3252649 RepID=UPI003619EB8E